MIGRIEGESNTRIIIPNEQLSNYTVNIYYTNSTDTTRRAEDKIELIRNNKHTGSNSRWGDTVCIRTSNTKL